MDVLDMAQEGRERVVVSLDQDYGWMIAAAGQGQGQEMSSLYGYVHRTVGVISPFLPWMGFIHTYTVFLFVATTAPLVTWR